MTLRRALPWLVVGLAIVVWAVPLQLVGWYDNGGITDIPTYREAYEHIASGEAPYARLLARVPAAGRRPVLARRASCPASTRWASRS